MEHVSFAPLCREAGQILNLFEPEALGRGEVVTIENIDLQIKNCVIHDLHSGVSINIEHHVFGNRQWALYLNNASWD